MIPFVTVAIATYNRSAMLRQTLAGIARQDYPADRHEVLVIDNNSSDDTRAAVASFSGSRVPPRHILETRQGLNHARNRAIREAKGEILLFGDDDILMEPDWIAQMVRPFARPEVGAVGGEVIPVFPDGLPDWVAGWHSPLAFRPEAGPLTPAQCPMGANFAFPMRIFAELGHFQEGLGRVAGNFMGGEDSEMIRRVQRAGREIWFAPAAAVRHQMPRSRTTFRYAARHGFDSARSRVIDRASQPSAAGYLVSRFFSNLLRAPLFGLLALVNFALFRTGAARKALVRAWRSCGYLYQTQRSLRGLR